MLPTDPPRPTVIDTPEMLSEVLPRLLKEESLAIDTEANSMYAYKERVCLIQISTPNEDLIIDPLAINDITHLGALFCNPEQEIIFHASEYDFIGLQRDHAFTFAGLFDTMLAARLLGYKQFGLANLLNEKFEIILNKKYQRANWGERPLSEEMLSYAAEDTRYLFALRDQLKTELIEKDLWQLAQEDFKRACFVNLSENNNHRPCWLKAMGKTEMTPRQQTILHALCQAREHLAERLDRPVFKVVDDAALVRVALAEPTSLRELEGCELTERQLKRFGKTFVRAVNEATSQPFVKAVPPPRKPTWFLKRMEKLKTWRKEKGEAIGVESDVVLPKAYMQPLVESRPINLEKVAGVLSDSPWRLERYGAEIAEVLK